MLETRCFKIKLKPDSLERVREWAQTINERKDEALETLRDESVFIEAVFLDSTEHGDFLISFMKAESFEKARKAVEGSLHSIDEYHRQFKRDVWVEVKQLETLVDLDRVEEKKEANTIQVR